MSKFIERSKATTLRQNGQSIRDIAKALKVSRSSVSVWCRDVRLSKEQVKKLAKAQEDGRYLGRIKGAESQRQKRLNEIRKLKIEGINETFGLTDNEAFVAGIGIYWGEGFKSGHKFGLSNSDPKLILFMVNWFKKFCNVEKGDFSCEVGINESHADRIGEVEKYWSMLTGLPLSQFTKTSLKKVKSKKIYENTNQHYGTLRIHIRKSSKKLRKALGWIEGLSRAV